MKRGEIYYITRRDTIGSEVAKSRPAVVVSNDPLTSTANVVEVVYLTTSPKKDQPTHVDIRATGVKSTAICEQIDSVSKLLVGNYCGCCTADKMARIDAALAISLGIGGRKKATPEDELAEKLEHAEAELDSLRKMLTRYENIVDALTGGARA